MPKAPKHKEIIVKRPLKYNVVKKETIRVTAQIDRFDADLIRSKYKTIAKALAALADELKRSL